MLRRLQGPLRLFVILALAALIRTQQKAGCAVIDLPIFEGSEASVTFPPVLPSNYLIPYKCKRGFIPIHGLVTSTMCRNGSWTAINDTCKRINCKVPPNIIDGFHNGTGPPYPYGIVIKYSCNENSSLIGLKSIYCNVDGLWRGKAPICQEVKCKDPVVQHGIKLTGQGKSHKYGSSVAFQCETGYFMIGNYLIRCEKDSIWVPKVPSCKKISPNVCGAPVILNGNLKPLQPQYESGQEVIISCNRNYSFLDETSMMIIQCQGYNLWNPPIQPCFFRLSSDISQLSIYHGKIVHGRKNYYKPGDEVVIQCHAGYIIIGPSKIKYIGGNKWFPNVPACHLREKSKKCRQVYMNPLWNAELQLTIPVCLLPVLILAIKMLYKKY